jgi:hypothetical protein
VYIMKGYSKQQLCGTMPSSVTQNTEYEVICTEPVYGQEITLLQPLASTVITLNWIKVYGWGEANGQISINGDGKLAFAESAYSGGA